MSANPAELELSLGLSDRGAELRAILLAPDSAFAFEVRGEADSASTDLTRAFDQAGYSGKFSFGLVRDKSTHFSFGALRPDGGLALILDPLVAELPAFGAMAGKPDPSLDSTLGGLILGTSALSFFAVEKRGAGDAETLSIFAEPSLVDDRPPHSLVTGLRASLPLGSALAGLSVGAGRSQGAGAAESWYDAMPAGEWQRTVAALFFASPRGNSRINFALGASTSIDAGSGLAFRLDAAESRNGEVLALSLAMRSPRFHAIDGDVGLLARGKVDFSFGLGNGLRLGIRELIDAREGVGDARPCLSRRLRFRIEGEGGNGLPLSLRLDLLREDAEDEAALGGLMVLRWELDALRLGVSTIARLEWAEAGAAVFENLPSSLAYSPPDALKLGIEASLATDGIPGLFALSLTSRCVLERQNPFLAAVPDPYAVSANLGLRFAAARNLAITVQGVADGGRASSIAASLGRAKIEASVESSLRLEL
ncbi:MAG TPA: hypothetical protein VMV83_08940 [Rectinemataceae bacterium]|nr:hypothetical protein [Rectinemataceae bacterium]